MSKEPVTPYKMNLPSALKERLEDAAGSNYRSVSGEIIARLEDSFIHFGSYSGEDRRSYVMGAAVGVLELLAGMSRGEDRDAFLSALAAMSRMGLAGDPNVNLRKRNADLDD